MQEIKKKLEDINRAVENNTKQLTIINADIVKRLNMTQKILLRGIQEAAEVHVPTTFIILHEKITKSTVKSSTKDVKSLGQFFTSFISLMSNKFEEKVEENANFYQLYDEVFFYLIDEYTGQPIIPDDDKTQYPIKITKYDHFMKSISPFLSIGFKFVTAANGLCGLCTLLGYPTISLPLDSMKYVDTFIKNIASGSDVNDFQVLQKCVVESNKYLKDDNLQEEIKSVRGLALRELERFFIEKDRKGDFCGLQKVISSTGQCIWTTDENHEKMKIESEKEINEPFDRSFFKNNMKGNETNDAVMNSSNSRLSNFSDQNINQTETDNVVSDTDDCIEENRCCLWTCPSCRHLWCTCNGVGTVTAFV